MPVTVIANGTNRGFPAAVNQGLQYVRGEYLVLLNNDVVVTDGWLEQMAALAGGPTSTKSETPNSNSEVLNSKSEMRIGLVGPMSNYARCRHNWSRMCLIGTWRR